MLIIVLQDCKFSLKADYLILATGVCDSYCATNLLYSGFFWRFKNNAMIISIVINLYYNANPMSKMVSSGYENKSPNFMPGLIAGMFYILNSIPLHGQIKD